jgi:hypothetical protein
MGQLFDSEARNRIANNDQNDSIPTALNIKPLK